MKVDAIINKSMKQCSYFLHFTLRNIHFRVLLTRTLEYLPCYSDAIKIQITFHCYNNEKKSLNV